MKKLFVNLLVVALTLCVGLNVYADDDPPSPPIPPVTIPFNPSGQTPRTPVTEPTCYYDGQYLTITFAYPEGDAEIEITDAGVTTNYQRSTSSPIVLNVGTLTFGAIIVITTDDINTYVGTYI